MSDDFWTETRATLIEGFNAACEDAWDFLSDPLFWIFCGLFVVMILWGIPA